MTIVDVSGLPVNSLEMRELHHLDKEAQYTCPLRGIAVGKKPCIYI